MTIKPSDDLNLPDAPDFISTPPTYTAAEMASICEKMLPYWNAARAKNPPPPFQGDAFTLDLPFSYSSKPTGSCRDH